MPHRRILIADDNNDAAESFARLLQLEGHEVLCARNGAEALRVFEEKNPDTAVLDISMPVLDGHEVARRIRAQERRHRVLLLALSGWGRDADIARSLEAGFDHHLVKPVEFPDFSRLLSEDTTSA